MCSPTMAWCRSLPDPRSGSQRESGIGHTQKTPLEGCASRAWKKRRPIWIAGNSAGRHAHPRHDETAGRGHVRRRKAALAPSASGSAITNTGSVWCIWTVAWRSRPLSVGGKLPPLTVELAELQRQGISIQGISKLSGWDRKTVRKYLLQPNAMPEYGPRRRQASKLDPFKAYLEERMHAGVWNAQVLF
jgi:hypothetical protein